MCDDAFGGRKLRVLVRERGRSRFLAVAGDVTGCRSLSVHAYSIYGYFLYGHPLLRHGKAIAIPAALPGGLRDA